MDGKKKSARCFLHTPKKRESISLFGALNLKTRKFYWKKAKKGNAKVFQQFLVQMEQNNPGKQLCFIVDNSSIHKSFSIKRFLKKHTNLHVFFLPPYSPEYAPIERLWRWIKTKVYSLYETCGIDSITEKIRKLIWHYNEGTLNQVINFQFEIYQELL